MEVEIIICKIYICYLSEAVLLVVVPVELFGVAASGLVMTAFLGLLLQVLVAINFLTVSMSPLTTQSLLAYQIFGLSDFLLTVI